MTAAQLEQRKLAQRDYYRRNRDKILARANSRAEERKEKWKRYYEENKAILLEKKREKRKLQPDSTRSQGLKQLRAWQKANPEKAHLIKLRAHLKKFHLSVDQFERMMAEQEGLCAICGLPETSTRGGNIKRLAVDHDHKTLAVRGLLCQNCNLGLGSFKDSRLNLSNAILYLEKFQPEAIS